MLKFKDGTCVEVEVHHNLAYRFYKVDSPEAYCVVSWLDFEVSKAKPEGKVVLINVVFHG
jgi:hypothetical protein